ncbi:MAG: tetratricopeptide repeat protein [Bacteroidota bacterium]|nr:tetratricopeptide repeat protein [Bacteroidota bacterium]
MTNIYSQTTPDQIFKEGLNAYYGAKYQDAIKFFDEYIKSEPGDSKGYNYRGLSYQGMNNYSRALEDFTKVISVSPSNTDGYLHRGNTYLQQQKFSQALTDFTDAIRFDTHNINAYLGKSRVYTAQKKYSSAMTELNSASGIDPKNAGVYVIKAWVSILADDTTKIIDYISKAMYYDSNIVFTDHKRELLNLKFTYYKNALAIANQRIDQNPNSYILYFSRGLIYFFMNNYEKASADLKKSKNLNNNYNSELDKLIDQIFRSINRNG